MGIAERKIRQKEEVYASILKAAWQIVEEEGWQALSIRKIAGAIEYSVPVIYDHFANKEAILQEFTKQGFRLLNGELMKIKNRYANPEQQIELMAYAYWDFAHDNKEYYQLMYGLGMPTCETVRQIAELHAFTEIILEPIRSLIENSNNKETDPLLKMRAFWSMLHGLISINMMSQANRQEELNNEVLRDFIKGFLLGVKG